MPPRLCQRAIGGLDSRGTNAEASYRLRVDGGASPAFSRATCPTFTIKANKLVMDALRKGHRNSLIDLLRGISIFVVVCGHYVFFFPTNLDWMSAATYAWLTHNIYYGVTLFFVISGFLITSNTIKRFGSLERVDPRKFYIARFARIYPLLIYLTVLLCILRFARVQNFYPPAGVDFGRTVWTALTFQYNWYYVDGGGAFAVWAPIWSLSIEEVFYLFFPVICLALRKDRLICIALVAFVVQAPLARVFSATTYYLTTNADALALGCLAAIFSSRLRSETIPRSLGAVLFCLGLALVTWRYLFFPLEHDRIFGPLVIALAGATSLVGAVIANPRRVFPPLELMGRRSYEIYLLHMTLLALMRAAIDRFGLDISTSVVWPVFIVLIAGLSEILGSRFTDPVNRLIVEGRLTQHFVGGMNWLRRVPSRETAPSLREKCPDQ